MTEVIVLPQNYTPSNDEEYMNKFQIEYFRQKLVKWKESLQQESQGKLENLRKMDWAEPDPADQAKTTWDAGLELRTGDRSRKLIEKIDAALLRIQNGTYGYCEETGVQIGIGRLEARPIATLSIKAQEEHERFEKQHVDDDWE